MAKPLPARPNLDHLRGQAKTLLATLKAGDPAAAHDFISHLPVAKRMSPADVRAAGFRLADAQSVIARKTGFGSWPLLSRHVDRLRKLEGEWSFASLEVDGSGVPVAMLSQSRLLMDGDRFRMESPEAHYEGTFTIDVGENPAHIDIEFVEGPEAGNWSFGIFDLNGDELTICLGVTGAPRPTGFVTSSGSGHALERLHRASTARPAGVTGGTPTMPASTQSTPRPEAPVNPSSFNVTMTPLLKRLEGEWTPVELVTNGEAMRGEWLAFGSRTVVGNEVKVRFGGQVMVHAKVRIDESTTPLAVDYLNLAGGHKGAVSLGIMDWVDDDACFLMAAPGRPRPRQFTETGTGLTLSRWRRRTG